MTSLSPGVGGLALALYLACLQPAGAEVSAEIVERGITIGRQIVPAQPDPGDRNLSPAKGIRAVRYLERTETIEARLCRSFGVTIRLKATPPGDLPQVLDVRIRHPKFTREDGATNSEDRFRTWPTGDIAHAGFSFDHIWEMEPGDWEIALLLHGVELARQPFIVTAPPPGAPSDCHSDEVS